MSKKHSNKIEDCNQWSDFKQRCLAERHRAILNGKGCTCTNNPNKQ